MSFLYVTERGTKVYIEGNRIVAEKPDGLKHMLPLELLEGVVLN